MIKQFATSFASNSAVISAKRDGIAQAALQAASRAAATPVFADISRFSEPSSTRMVWMATTTGQHPSFV